MKTTSVKVPKSTTKPLAKELKRALSSMPETPLPFSQNLGEAPLLNMEDDWIPDQKTIARWHKQAKMGDAIAQYNLGVAYSEGKDVPKDDETATQWFQKAADQGHATAQFHLGIAYRDGKGVPKDDKEAFECFSKAAKQGFAGYFLWVEDFQTTSGRTEVANTIKNVFGEILDQDALPPTMAEEVTHFFQQQKSGVFVERTFFDALQFLYTPEKLLKADYIVLDIDLPLESDSEEEDTNNPIYLTYSEIRQRYPNDKEFEKVAGYQLYVELVMNLGFPKEHILFCSNHEQYLTSIKTATPALRRLF